MILKTREPGEKREEYEAAKDEWVGPGQEGIRKKVVVGRSHRHLQSLE